jgi:hypothetical protein
MAAPKNNQFWKNRSVHGREKLFETPELLWQAAQEYFNWCDTHPWYKPEAVKGGDLAGTIMDVPTPRPYTISGLCIYLDASRSYWNMFKGTDGLSKDFLRVIGKIEEIIYTQKFEGASVGVFNSNIIARDLGLKEQTEISGKIFKVEISDE